MVAEGFKAEWLKAKGFKADGLKAKGLKADGLKKYPRRGKFPDEASPRNPLLE